MKIAVFADVHGNADALKAVLQDIDKRNIQTVYNLGDSLYGPLLPVETYNLLHRPNIYHISGNCDRLLLDEKTTNETVKYVQAQLNSAQRSWLSQLPSYIETEDFYFCHGTPTSDEIYLLEIISSQGTHLKHVADIMKEIESIPQQLIFCAHTHIPRIVYLPNNQIVINPGSVGLPAYEDEVPSYHKMESCSPFAQYTIVEKQDKEWKIDQIQVPYDRKRVISMSKKNNRLDWAIAFKTGRMS